MAATTTTNAAPAHHGPNLSPEDSGTLFVESLAILALSIVGTAAVMLGVLHRKYDRAGHAQYAERWRRHREIRKFLDFTVLILLGFELVQSVNWLAGTILSEKLYSDSPYGVRSRETLSPKQVRGLTTACKVVGGLTYSVDIFLYLWHACLAYSMYSWIVRKALLRHLYERMKTLCVVALVISLFVSLVPALMGDFGALPTVTCWLSTLDVTNPSVILNKLIILPLCWAYVGYVYTRTFSYIWIRRQLTSLAAPITKSYARLRRRLLLFALIFFIAWFINSVWYFLLAFNRASLVLGVICKLYYAMGFVDALASGYGSSSMGGVTFHLRARLTRLGRRVQRAFQRLRRLPETAPSSFPTRGSTPEEAAEEGWSGLARVGGARRRREMGEEGNEGDYFRVRSSWFTFMPEQDRGDEMGPFPAAPVILEEETEDAVALEVENGSGGAPGQGPVPVLEMKETIQYVSARIFATSLNCGGLDRLAELGCIEEWVPKDGYDLYVIALQECRVLGPLRRAIHYHLGGPRLFQLFEQELGDTLVGNGKIALLIFGRVADVQRGVLKLAETGGKGHVASGVDLIFSRFHNKGVVGVALQYYGTAIAFLVAHYASDSGGRKRWERRDEDAWRTLHMLHLAGDVEDFDVHLQHHHVVLLGDLNYRCQVFVGEILGKIAAASEVEKARRGWPPYSGHAWRDDSYNRFFLPPPRRRLPAEAAGRGITSAMRDPGVMEAQGKARGKARRREEAKEVKEAREAREREREGEGERRGEQATASENGWETAAEVEREGSGSGSEGGSVASAHSLADLLAVMRDADCPMTTRDDVAAQEDPGARHWAWACEVDELSLSRKAGVALFGFQEGPLAFPPTFKFFPGRLVEDYADVTDLRYGYQVTKGARALSLPSMSDGGGGSPGRSRPPSWTDRILYHSLPGLESRLLLEAYDTCDAITGSDHRPVVAAFQLLLDKPANNKPSPLTTGGPILPAPSPPPSLFFPEALPSISEQPQKQPPQPQQPQPPAPPGPGDRPPRRIEQPGPAEEFKEEPAAPAPPRPASLGTAASAATGGGGGGGSGGLPLVRRATPPGPPPAQMARMSTTASSVGGGGGGGAGFQPLVPPSTTKSVLVSVRLANFAFRFKLPRKPELQIAGQQKKGKRGARGAAVAGPTAEERESGPTEGSEEEGQQQQQRQEQGRGRDHGQRQADTEVEVFEAPSAWRARRATAGQQQREGSESESESGEDFPPDVPALAIPTDTSSYVTPQLAHNPPSYTRQRTMPIPSRVPLRAFWSIGAAGAEAAASLRRMGEQRAAEAPAVPTDEDIGWVVVMMPIPCEDPLIGHRRIVMMMDDPDMLPPPPTGNGAAATAPRNGKRLGSWLWPSGRSPPASAGAAGEAPGPLEAGAAGGGGGDVADAPLRLAAMAEEEEEHARQHVHRFAWADVQARGRKSGASSALRVEALVVPAGGMHAAFKFLDKKGRDLGQGVVCMKEVVLRGRVGPQRVTMQLSVGGVHFGEVAVDVVIKSRTGALGPAAAGMSRASSFGTLGAAAVAAAAAVGGGPGVPVPVPRVGDAEEGERGEM